MSPFRLALLVLALGLGAGRTTPAEAEDPPAAPDAAAELSRAKELQRQVQALWSAGKYAEALPLAREALAVTERLLPPDDFEVAVNQYNLAAQLRGLGRPAESRPHAEAALAAFERLGGPHQAQVAHALVGLATDLAAGGDADRARKMFERALALRESLLGPEHALVATTLRSLADLASSRQSYAEARPLLERAAAIQEKALGPAHPELAATLNNLGWALTNLGALAEARAPYERALAIREHAYGPTHAAVAHSLTNLTNLLWRQGDLAAALPLARRVLALREAALGRDHPMLEEHHTSLGSLLQQLGDDAGAELHLARALELAERSPQPSDQSVGTRAAALGRLLAKRGRPAEARPHLEAAQERIARAQGPASTQRLQLLNELALVLKDLKEVAAAREIQERAVALAGEAVGPEILGPLLVNLGHTLATQGALAEAEATFRRALTVLEEHAGAADTRLTSSLLGLGDVLKRRGRFREALAHDERARVLLEDAGERGTKRYATLLRRLGSTLHALGLDSAARETAEEAVRVAERSLGAESVDMANSLNSLATLLLEQGSTQEARPLFERALAITDKAMGSDHEFAATVLNNLGALNMAEGDYARAGPMYERALAALQAGLGREHPTVGLAHSNVAAVALHAGAHARAQARLEEARGILERALGTEHVLLANVWMYLSRAHFHQGRLPDARAAAERAIAVGAHALGDQHAGLSSHLLARAAVAARQGEAAAAQADFLRALALVERQSRAHLASWSARQRMAQQRQVRETLDRWLEFAPAAGSTGLVEALRLCGLVSRAESAERALARHPTPETSALKERLDALGREAARLANDMPPASRPDARAAWQRAYAEVNAEHERARLELSKHSAPHRAALERLELGLPDVQAHLAPDAALVNFLRVRERYVAWVVHGSGEPRRLDLGEAEPLEAACAGLVSAVARDTGDAVSAEDLRSAAQGLHALAWAPLLPLLGSEVTRVVICPDAALAAVPFAVLPGRAPGRVLADDLRLALVSHPFDLVASREAAPKTSGALLVGGVDYERAGDEPATNPDVAPGPALAMTDRAPKGRSFSPIPETLREATALRERFAADAGALLSGSAATEARVREGTRGRRWLHVATHGFSRDDLRAGLSQRRVADEFLSADQERQLAAGHDPMLLSGLALAGANPREGGGGDDGILTALEASYLDLEGCDLVTLSACETARGTAESGEGVLGLVAAFQMAGARNVIASLWNVDDEATRLLMEGFYERLLRAEQPLSPADALREAALALRDRREPDGTRRFAAPRYWAAFVAYGG
jgi:CHAT domain-containing protein/tetratricopeptide (TPR) repeat protein